MAKDGERHDTSGQAAALSDELQALRREVSKLNEQSFIRIHNSVPRLLAYSFARGLAVGLGTVLGATVLLSFVIWSLSQIEFVPIIGEYVTEIIDQINAGGDTADGSVDNTGGTAGQ
ncbi:MAG: DUF5665 domain-containing protein [Pseudomonadota bacterium]